jgi:hypothetical protein
MLGIRPNASKYTMIKPDVQRFFSDVNNWPHKFQAAVLVNGALAFGGVTLSINRWDWARPAAPLTVAPAPRPCPRPAHAHRLVIPARFNQRRTSKSFSYRISGVVALMRATYPNPVIDDYSASPQGLLQVRANRHPAAAAAPPPPTPRPHPPPPPPAVRALLLRRLLCAHGHRSTAAERAAPAAPRRLPQIHITSTEEPQPVRKGGNSAEMLTCDAAVPLWCRQLTPRPAPNAAPQVP